MDLASRACPLLSVGPKMSTAAGTVSDLVPADRELHGRGRGGKVLYLDFDGVLHPEDVHWHPKRGIYLAPKFKDHRLFENTALLISVLLQFPDVEVVLSTSWVPVRGFERTLKCLPEQLRARVVGATFHSEHMLHENWAAIARGYQILCDVSRRKPAHWVAVDDDIADWPEEHLDKLVATDGALGLGRPGAIDELVRKMGAW